MSDPTSENSRRDQRIVRHMKALEAALGNEEAYQQALNGIRDDNALTGPQREAIYKTLAQQSLLWYIEALKGEPVDVEELASQLHAQTSSNS
ncbi:MAG: hypothetical protein EP343_22505 [Deltaproteobacteria bacterium]|nr:MAG: hypothetical protein EP343_22505 [Deltaproteobacteria bacterium]